MLTNPISMIGWIAVAAGWIMLLVFPGAAGASIVNIHRLAIAESAILSGFALVLIGLANENFRSLSDRARPAVEDAQASDTPSEASARAPAIVTSPSGYEEGHPPNFNLLAKTHTLQVGRLKASEIHEMRDGLFLLHDGSGWRSFSSLEKAQEHLAQHFSR